MTTYTYDEANNLTSETDAEGRVTRFEYDAVGRRILRELPQGQVEFTGYDAEGRMTSQTDFNGMTTTFTYDSLGRLTRKEADPAHPSRALAHAGTRVDYVYDNLSQLVSAAVSNDTGNTIWEESFTYDVRDRLAEKTTTAGTLAYTYDAAGNLLSTTSSNSGGVANSYGYDVLNRLVSVGASQYTGETTYSYDPNGNLSSYLYPNGVSHVHTYDDLNRLQTLGVSDVSQVVQGYGYTLSDSGNRTIISETSGRVSTYAYDATYKLRSENISGSAGSVNGLSTFSYDKVGNRLNQATSIPGLSNLTLNYTDNDWISSDTMDANGNTIASSQLLNGADVYDFEDRLVRRIKPDGTVIDITYNADGDRVKKSISVAGQPLIEEIYHVDRNNHSGFAQVIEETSSTGGALTNSIIYIYGHDLICQSENGQLSYFTYDGLGSVRGLSDSSGIFTDTFDYDAWGNLLERTGTTSNVYLFAGEQYDPDLELYYLRARYMDAGTGRFWNRDTYEGRSLEPLTLHKYLYAHANPVMNVDPTGNFSLAGLLTTVRIQSQRLAKVSIRGRKIIKNVYRVIVPAAVILNYKATLADAVSKKDKAMLKALPKALPQQLKLIKEFRKRKTVKTSFVSRILKLGELGVKASTADELGVDIKYNGLPDFRKFRHPKKPVVNIKFTGTRSGDFNAANRKRGGFKLSLPRLPNGAAKPSSYTWHHHEVIGVMELIESSTHSKLGHNGGVFFWEILKQKRYP